MAWNDRISAEINTVMDGLAEKGEDWIAQWIAQHVCEMHRGGLRKNNEDADFWEHCGYRDVREQVRKTISRRTDPERVASEDQLTLPGYERLQFYYSVARDKEAVGVSVFHMTDAELAAKAAELRSMAKGLYAHADEIDRFREERAAKVAI